MDAPFTLPGRYRALGKEFKGGQATVALYSDTNLDRTVAVKLMRADDDVGSYEREIRSFQSVRSRHVVDVYDMVVGTSKLALIEEYLVGPDLTDQLADGSRPIELLDVYQIAAGLADIHAAGVVHRDLKPSNIRRGESNYLKILDFGISTVLEDGDVTRTIRGTRGFLAPEMYRLGPKRVEPSADLYSFGLVALLILAPNVGIRLLNSNDAIPPSLFTNNCVGLAEADTLLALDLCLSADPSVRPSAARLRDLSARDLLRGRHHALMRSGGDEAQINSATPVRGVDFGALGSLNVGYDGLRFVVQDVNGTVVANRLRLHAGAVLSGSSVIAFGVEGGPRTFVTFDVSHPEVMP